VITDTGPYLRYFAHHFAALSDDYHVCSCVSQENATVKRKSDKTVKTKKTITPRLISWGLSAKWRP